MPKTTPKKGQFGQDFLYLFFPFLNRFFIKEKAGEEGKKKK
jgi:hypothetical protein